MRPLKLELEGFTAFKERQSLDFEDLDLFAITGPTGAGKSSLIDAIAYALYGRVPRLGSNVGACISHGLPRMWVQLEFLAEHEYYRVFRETKAAGQRSIRLERRVGDDWMMVVTGATQVNQRIEEIVGLDFDGFTRSVLLPQDHFQEFLAGDAAKRREVLARLLRLDVYQRVGARARHQALELKAKISTLQDLLATAYADTTPEAVQALRQEIGRLQAEARALETLIAELASALELAQGLARARAALQDARRQQGKVADELRAKEALVATGDEQVQTLEASLQDLKTRLAQNCFDPDRLSALRVAEQMRKDLDALCAEREQVGPALAQAAEAIQRATAEVESASRDFARGQADSEAAEKASQAAIKANAAAVVQQDLQPGAPCPVCGASVGDLPHIECPDLTEAQAQRERAQRVEKAAGDQFAQAQTRREVAVAKGEAAERRVQDLQQRVERVEGELAASLPEQDRSSEAIQRGLRQQQEAQRERAQLEKGDQEARRERQALLETLAQAKGDLHALQSQTETLQTSAKRADEEFAANLEALRNAAAGKDWGAKLVGLDAGERLEAAVQSSLDQARIADREVQSRRGQTGQRLEDLQGKIAHKQELEQEVAAYRARYDVAYDLGQVMQADLFGAFVQSEAVRVLAEEGSHRLESLSSGRYRLQVAANSQDFDVVDQWNGEETRSVKTLSGGETFLASLALALTLAETLPGLAPGQRVVLDSIFIDEGFGSLDPEALDKAADALDALRADKRLVCVITHLKELAERMPARIEVIKSESGSRAEIRA